MKCTAPTTLPRRWNLLAHSALHATKAPSDTTKSNLVLLEHMMTRRPNACVSSSSAPSSNCQLLTTWCRCPSVVVSRAGALVKHVYISPTHVVQVQNTLLQLRWAALCSGTQHPAAHIILGWIYGFSWTAPSGIWEGSAGDEWLHAPVLAQSTFCGAKCTLHTSGAQNCCIAPQAHRKRGLFGTLSNLSHWDPVYDYVF